MRKPGNAVPDEDCPEDPHSVRYWTKTAMRQDETDSAKQALQTRIGFRGSPELANATLGNQGMAPVSRELQGIANRNKDAGLALIRDLQNGAGGGSIHDAYFHVNSNRWSGYNV